MQNAATSNSRAAHGSAPAGEVVTSVLDIDPPVLLGRRERAHGAMRSVTDIGLASIVEAVDELAIADRVAYVMARRTGVPHVVVTAHQTWLVATTTVHLTGDDAAWILPEAGPHRIVSIATQEGITPLLVPA
jgi:hypothetical protein